MKTYNSIKEYLHEQPPASQKILASVLNTIRTAAPGATESISYNMPAFHHDGILVYVAACRNHIGFYPLPSGIKKFYTEISMYKNSKSAVQFPLDQPIPHALITQIVKFRIKENRMKAILKKNIKIQKKKLTNKKKG